MSLQASNFIIQAIPNLANEIPPPPESDPNLVLVGTRRRDRLQGEDGDDLIKGKGNNDKLLGGDGNDKLVGGSGKDQLRGGPGEDTLIGGSGSDLLNGGLGSDVLTGGRGRDLFNLTRGQGRDTILDFENGRDSIDLSGALSFGQLDILQRGSNTLIKVDSERLALLKGIDADSINRADFT